MAKATKSKKKPIDQYDHKGKKRVNNPPVGLVTPETDKETGKKSYVHDPHLDPAFQFDSQRSQVEEIIENGLSGETVEEVRTKRGGKGAFYFLCKRAHLIRPLSSPGE